MKAKKKKNALIILGIALAFFLSMSTIFIEKENSGANCELEVVSNYKSTIPLITAPLQVLARGLKIVDK